MKRSFTYGYALEQRNITVADILAKKASGNKMTPVTA